MLELYREYNLLNKAIQPLSAKQKQELVGLTLKPEWGAFTQMLNNWKTRITGLCIQTGKTSDDLLSAQAQCRNIAVLKTFQNQYKKSYVKPIENTEDDPTDVPL